MKIRTLKLFTVLSLLFFLVGCNQNSTQETDNKTVTVTTTFIEDMVNVLVEEDINLNLIIPAGEDPHLYVSKPEDLTKLEEADLILYHGIHFEAKMDEILSQMGVAITKDFNRDDITNFEEDGLMVKDPHFWFDIDLYKQAMYVVKDELISLLPERKDSIEANYMNYMSKLDELDESNRQKINSIDETSRYLITPHDAFNYLSNRYGIEVRAPQGLSTDSEVSNREIEETAQFIVDHNIKAIFAESTTNPDRMRKLQEIVQNKGYDVNVISGEGNELYSDSLAPKGEYGDNYIDMYEHNINLIYSNLK